MTRPTTSSYTLQGGDEGKSRLDLLSRVLEPTTRALLDHLPVPIGGRCLDVGCGGGHVTRMLAEMVGPTGSADGIDMDARVIELARADTEAAGVRNAHFLVHELADLDESDFDLAYTRLVLLHLADPAGGLAAMARAVRPGGVVVAEEPDFGACYSSPPNGAFDRFLELQDAVIARRGGDPRLGLRLHALFIGLGLEDIRVRIVQPVLLDRDDKQLAPVSLDRLRDTIVGEGIAATEEIEAVRERLQTLADEPLAMFTAPRLVQVWGRIPAR